jgi:monomeric isocitrate dehydrogenase
MQGGGLFETGAGGSAYVEQFTHEGYFGTPWVSSFSSFI